MGIEEYRRKNKVTQAQFAEQMNVDVRTVQHWSAGDRLPHRKHRLKFWRLNQESGNPIDEKYFSADRSVYWRTMVSGAPVADGLSTKHVEPSRKKPRRPKTQFSRSARFPKSPSLPKSRRGFILTAIGALKHAHWRLACFIIAILATVMIVFVALRMFVF